MPISGLIQWSTESELKAFKEGIGDYQDGLTDEDCPWLDAARESVAWRDGWNAAERYEREQEPDVQDSDFDADDEEGTVTWEGWDYGGGVDDPRY